jgi:adenine-specific DNA-methyltransferase
MNPLEIHSEDELLALCGSALGRGPRPTRLIAVRDALLRGGDPLGDALGALRSPEVRRRRGATYTPPALVEAMVGWAARKVEPARVVDPGAGTGRFLLAAARAFPRARLIGVEIDPVAAAVARANLELAGLRRRADILVGDYRELELQGGRGTTLFIGNPPYVRHHDISPRWKSWLTRRGRAHGLPVSQLAGLHLHFLLATLEHAAEGDAGCFVTAAEWLDVNYGALARGLLAGPLGLERLDVLEPTAQPFADALTTAVIAGFRVGASGPVTVRRVREIGALGALTGGRVVPRERLTETRRWTALLRPRRARPAGMVELGELCRVHRGQVTGCNRAWILSPHTPALPAAVRYPAVTRARELFAARGELLSCASLREVIDLPADLDALAAEARRQVEQFLRFAEAQGARAAYVARHRSPWWSVRLRPPAPILATYMARRPPAFVRNRPGARHLNIAHGLYPRVELSEAYLDALAGFLSARTSLEDGRTYAGGLTKFEPREMERLLVPPPGPIHNLPPHAPRVSATDLAPSA